MSDIGETRICVQKMLPHHQSEYDALQRDSRSPQHMQRLSAAFFAKKIWPKNTNIKIAFMGTGNQIKRTTVQELKASGKGKMDPLQEHVDGLSVQQAVKKIVRERIQPLVNLRLEFIENPEQAHVRISFEADSGAWSLVGTDALHEKTAATMNLGWFDVSTTIHEFGHMLGMIHEHQNPHGQEIKWNDSKVFAWAKSTQGWSEKTTEDNIIKKYDSSAINGSSFDPLSIMLYFFPPDLTTNDQGTHQNLRLSGEDVLWIHNIYPVEHGETPATFYQKTYSQSLTSSIAKSAKESKNFGKGSGFVNWKFKNFGKGGSVDWKFIGIGAAIIILIVAAIWWFIKKREKRGGRRYGRY